MTFVHKYIDEGYADLYESEYIQRFGKAFAMLLWQTLHLNLNQDQKLIDFSASHGFPSLLFLRKLSPNSQIVALSEDYIALRYLHLMAGEEDNRRIFARFQEDGRTPLASNYFDAGYLNLAFDTISNIPVSLAELARLVKPMGKVALVAPLQDSLSEIYDLVANILNTMEEPEYLTELMANRLDAADENWLLETMRNATIQNIKLFCTTFTVELPQGSYVSRDPLLNRFLLRQVMRTLPSKMQKIILHRLSAIRAAAPFNMQVKAACAIGEAPDSPDLPLAERLIRARVT